MPVLWPGREIFPSFVWEDCPLAWHLNRLKRNVFCCKHLICSFWTVWVTRSKTRVKCPKQCLSAVDFFILLVLKPLKGGKKDSYCISTKASKKLVGSLLQQNEYMLLSTDHLSPDYNRPQGDWCRLWIPPALSESCLAVTVPPPILTAQSTGESALSTVGFSLLSKLKQGFLVCSV